MKMEIAEIFFEIDAENRPARVVAELDDVVAYVQLAANAEDVAMRLCYPFKTLAPIRGDLARFGQQPVS